MTTLDNRPNSALLIIDVQKNVLAETQDTEAVVANIVDLIAKARAAGSPVIWVQHSSEEMPEGSEGWEFVPELQPAAEEPLVHKKYGDSFEDTELEKTLADAQVGHLLVAGAQTDACIRSTLHGAFTRGYDTTLIADAHTTEDLSPWGAPSPAAVIAHTNLYWSFQSAPGRTAKVVDAADVVFANI